MHNVRITPGFVLLWILSLMIFPMKFVIAWIITVMIHELGHLLSIQLLGIQIHGITFEFTGIRIRTEPMIPLHEIITAAAGPAFGVVLILLSYHAPLIKGLAIIQTCCNMIPIYPIDGGRVVDGILALVFDENIAANISYMLKIFCVGILIVISLFSVASYGFGAWIMLIGIIFLLKRKLSCKHGRQEIQ